MNTKVLRDLITFSSRTTEVCINNGCTILIKLCVHPGACFERRVIGMQYKLLINRFLHKKEFRAKSVDFNDQMGCDADKTEIIAPSNILWEIHLLPCRG